VLEEVRTLAGPGARITVAAAHSGGGALLHAALTLQTPPTLPKVMEDLEDLIFLDANYAFQDSLHGEPLARWLGCVERAQLVSLAYDDRKVVFQGKPVMGPTGGTLRANLRMGSSLTGRFIALASGGDSETTRVIGLKGRIRLETLPNTENRILHTVLVERNGLIHALSDGGSPHWMKDPIYRPLIRPLRVGRSAAGIDP
jgi:hypothetical protein